MSQVLENMKSEIDSLSSDYVPEQLPTEPDDVSDQFNYNSDKSQDTEDETVTEDKTGTDGKTDDEQFELNGNLFPDEIKDEDENENEDEGVSKEDADLIDSRVELKLAPLRATAETRERTAMVDSFMNGEGNIFKQFADPIKSLFNDPKFQKMGLKNDVQLGVAVAMAVGWKSLIKMGAMRERNASNHSRGSITGGSGSSRPASQDAGGIPDVKTMTSENFAKLREGVKSGRIKVGQ